MSGVQTSVQTNDMQQEHGEMQVDAFWVDEIALRDRPSVSPFTTRSASVLDSTSDADLHADGQSLFPISAKIDLELSVGLANSLSARRSMRIRDKINTQGKQFRHAVELS